MCNNAECLDVGRHSRKEAGSDFHSIFSLAPCSLTGAFLLLEATGFLLVSSICLFCKKVPGFSNLDDTGLPGISPPWNYCQELCYMIIETLVHVEKVPWHVLRMRLWSKVQPSGERKRRSMYPLVVVNRGWPPTEGRVTETKWV